MMRTLKTWSIGCTLLASMGLMACQSTTTANNPPHKVEKTDKHQRGMQQGYKHGFHAENRPDWKNMTPEQRSAWQEERQQQRMAWKEKMQQQHSERRAHYEALNKACEAKVGQTIKITLDDKTYTGQCNVKFHPVKDEQK